MPGRKSLWRPGLREGIRWGGKAILGRKTGCEAVGVSRKRDMSAILA